MLVSGLEQIEETAGSTLRSHLLQLALLLLNDWVFTQEPKAVRDVVGFLSSERNLRLLIASRSSWDDDRLTLPARSGRKELAAKAEACFLSTSEAAYLSRLGLLLRLNTNVGERWRIWREVRERGNAGLFQASCLGLFLDADRNEKIELVDTYGSPALHALISFGRWDDLTPEERISAVEEAARQAPPSAISRRQDHKADSDADLYRVYMMLNPYAYSVITYSKSNEMALDDAMVRYGVYRYRHVKRDAIDENALFDVTTAASRASRHSTNQWRTSLEPWSDFVESVRRTWGEGIRAYCLAAIAAGIISKSIRSAAFEEVFEQKLPLVERARYARLKTSVTWWRKALDDASTDDQILWILILLLSWAPSAIVTGVASRVTKILQELDHGRWNDLTYAVRAVTGTTRLGRQSLGAIDEASMSTLDSPRLKALLTLRLSRSVSLRTLAELLDSYDGQDRTLAEFLASEGISEASREPKIWKNVIGFCSKYGVGPLALDVDDIVGEERFYFGRRDMMPAAIAQKVAEDQNNLPLGLLELAEMSLSRRSGASLNPLGRVALDENWFPNGA